MQRWTYTWFVTCVSLIAVCIVLGACAKVKVRKVPTPTQYEEWSDELQRRADSMDGLRFYLPRPFVNVHESFPVATDIYLASGVVSPDGKYVIVHKVKPLMGSHDIEWDVQPGTAFDTKTIVRRDVAQSQQILQGLAGVLRGQGVLQTDDENSQADDVQAFQNRVSELEGQLLAERADTKLADDKLKQRLDDMERNNAGTQAPAGVATTRMRNDNSAVAYFPMRGNLDIVYLPDFEEQYVIESQAGLGNVQVAINLGQGWSLQGLDAVEDNSELAALTLDLIKTAVDSAKAIATSGTTLATDALAEIGSGMATPQADVEKLNEPAGTPVTLKIVVVHYAAKGLYPVIKPRELENLPPNAFLIDLLSRNNSVIGRAMKAMTDEGVRDSIKALELVQNRFTVPVYPYQYISFNTFQYVSIEALSPSGSDFGDLYDKTGTQGDHGNSQSADLEDVIRDLMRGLFTATTEKTGTISPKQEVYLTGKGDEPTKSFGFELEREIINSVQLSSDPALASAPIALFPRTTLDDSWVVVSIVSSKAPVQISVDINLTGGYPTQPAGGNDPKTVFEAEVKRLIQAQLDNDGNLAGLKDLKFTLSVNESAHDVDDGGDDNGDGDGLG